MRHVIVGNGAAGTSAALAIRKIDGDSEILILSEEPVPFYSRIRLVDYLAGETEEQGLIIFSDSWYREKNILLKLNCTVTAIDPRARVVQSAGGEAFAYDRLLIAAGSLPFIPPLPGSDRRGIFTLRTVEDARAIAEYSRAHKRAAVIGGGLLGIEVGNALRKRGARVTIVEVLTRLLPRQTDPEASAILQRTLEGMGLQFSLGTKVVRFDGDDRVTGLFLEDGRRLDTEMAVFSAGVRPRLALFQDIGAPTGKGVLVNDRMETGIENIYAAGDIAEHRGVVYGIWPAAEQQGRVAGSVMAGGKAAYQGTVPLNTLKVAGVDLVAAGLIDAEGRLECVIQKDPEQGVYRKLVFSNGTLVGCILCGDLRGKREILSALQDGHKRDQLQGLMRDTGILT